jgi:hypothetical protein
MIACSNYAVENPVTASHRPALGSLGTHLLLSAVNDAIQFGDREPGEPPPSKDTILRALNGVAEIPANLIGAADVSSFWGEIHISWNVGRKQVVLMYFPERDPLVHHYENFAGRASEHDIASGQRDEIVQWLRWLRV